MSLAIFNHNYLAKLYNKPHYAVEGNHLEPTAETNRG